MPQQRIFLLFTTADAADVVPSRYLGATPAVYGPVWITKVYAARLQRLYSVDHVCVAPTLGGLAKTQYGIGSGSDMPCEEAACFCS